MNAPKKQPRKKKVTLKLTDQVVLDLLMRSVDDVLAIQNLNINPEQTTFELELDLLKYADPKYNYFQADTDSLTEGANVVWGSGKFHDKLKESGLWITKGRLLPYFDDAASLTLELTVQRSVFISIEAC